MVADAKSVGGGSVPGEPLEKTTVPVSVFLSMMGGLVGAEAELDLVSSADLPALYLSYHCTYWGS